MTDIPSDFDPTLERAPRDFETPYRNWRSLFARFTTVAAPSLLVVDLSHYNAGGKIDFGALRISGVQGVVLKCSESTTYKDTTFEYNWQAAIDNDFAVMMYHFFRDKPGIDEFNWFLTCADNFLSYVDGHTAVALDVETNNGVSASTRADRAFDFCNRVKAAGMKAGIYSSPGLVSSLFPYGETRWSYLDWQWVAHWTSAVTYALPAGWSNSLVKAWQFGISPTHAWVPKITGAGTVDVNRMFFASEADLKAWLGQGQTSDYPFGVRVTTSTVKRDAADPMAEALSVETVGTGLVVDDATDDVDGRLWYFIGSGWLPAADVDPIDAPIVDPPLPPPPLPPPVDTVTYTVTADKTLARFVYGYNDAGKPIFQIYPGDSITTGRFRYDTGAKIVVWPSPIRGDGGGDYYKMAVSPVSGCDLYLLASDGVLG